jgi:hypothetical protein
LVLAADSVTLKTAVPPAYGVCVADVFPTETVTEGGVLSRIVPVACPVEIEAFVGLLRVTLNALLGAGADSVRTLTFTELDVEPAGIVRLPEVAV